MHRVIGTGWVAIVSDDLAGGSLGRFQVPSTHTSAIVGTCETRMQAHRYPVVVGPDLGLRYASAFDDSLGR